MRHWLALLAALLLAACSGGADRNVTVEEAWALGREKNAFQYGDLGSSMSAADSAQDREQQSCCAG